MARTLADMTPEEARAELGIIAHPGDPVRFFNEAMRALETLADMKIEAQYLRNYDTGRYERHTRTVGEWVKNDD